MILIYLYFLSSHPVPDKKAQAQILKRASEKRILRHALTRGGKMSCRLNGTRAGSQIGFVYCPRSEIESKYRKTDMLFL